MKTILKSIVVVAVTISFVACGEAQTTAEGLPVDVTVQQLNEVVNNTPENTIIIDVRTPEEVAEGIYTAVSGPNYVSKAELRLIRNWGSDTIGMSTIPEVIVANHMGMKILGISCITDMAVPDSLESVSHEQVMEMANKVKPDFIKLVKGIVKSM